MSSDKEEGRRFAFRASTNTIPKTVAREVCVLVYVAAVFVKRRDGADERPQALALIIERGLSTILPRLCPFLHLEGSRMWITSLCKPSPV